MSRTEIIAALREKASEIRSLGAISLYLFGSAARGEATEKSDVDLAGSLGRAEVRQAHEGRDPGKSWHHHSRERLEGSEPTLAIARFSPARDGILHPALASVHRAGKHPLHALEAPVQLLPRDSQRRCESEHRLVRVFRQNTLASERLAEGTR